ncbi:MAG: hypothetical protein P8K77_05355 [Polaribacter sp.]|nr:hypothetical protein [Polaribacter sp.]
MLSQEQRIQIPKRTQQYWSTNKEQQYDYSHWVKPYAEEFENIEKVHNRINLKRTIRFIIKMSDGYHQVLKEVNSNKKVLKKNANYVVSAIDQIIDVSKIKVKRACRFYGVSSDWYYREKRKINCSLNIFSKCFKQHPNQLTFEETNAIERLVKDPKHFGKTKVTLYYHALRNESVSCAKSTFSKYAKALGYKKPKKPKTPPRIGVRATRIFEWLHVDITLVPTLEGGMQKVAFVKDNFSKAILHWDSVSEKANSKFITKLFKETFNKHDLYKHTKPITILTDGGSENKGAFTTWVNHFNAPPIVTKITARTVDFPLSNSMSESTHSIYKTEFLKGQISRTVKNHLDSLVHFVEYYNHVRHPADLYGLTTMEVVNGKVPDKNFFKSQIAEAKLDRVIKNQAFNECAFIG